MQKFNNFRQKMRKSVNLFKFVKIDFSFFLILFIAIVIGEVKLYLCFVSFLVLHELSHFFVAKKLGYMASKIHLNFFGASLEGLDDFSISDEIKIVLAGPMLNVCVIIFCYLSFWFYPESYEYLNEVLLANIGIFMFNFLPIYPLDLGRIILTLFSKKYKREDSLKKTKKVSICFIFMMFVAFLVSFFFDFNFTLGFVCVNLACLLFKETKGTSFRREMFVNHKLKLIKKGLLERNVYVKSDTPLYSLFKFIDDYHFVNFMFVNDNFETVNMLSEMELYKKSGYA